ncbi:MAG TPA: hypothetical protein ENI92_09470 [Bacteroidetes bacterium]|nr:hypothetical protein [Bacteroidota bacterium]
MRVTQQTKTNQLLLDLERRQNEILRSQRVLTTGREVDKPSDDPSRARRALMLSSSIKRRDQHIENINDANAKLGYTEGELQHTQDLLNEARSLALQGSSGTLNDKDLEYLSYRVDEILHELVAVANARHEGQYIFGGFNTQEPPYSLVTDATTGETIMVQDLASGMDGVIYRITADGERVPGNVPGTDVFQTGDPGDSGDMFQVMIDLRDALQDGDRSTIQGALDRIDEAAERVRGTIAKVGGYMQRLQATETRQEDMNVLETEHLSEAQDADIAEWISRWQLQQVALETAMNVGARVITTSLVNFIR